MIIYVEQEIYDRLNERLENMPQKIPSVLKKTINSAARYGKNKAVKRRVKERYVIKKADEKLSEASEFESASGKDFQATITIKGHPEPLIDFNVRRNKGKVAARARVLKTSPLTRLVKDADGKRLKAFIATIENEDKHGGKSYHVGVFRRMTEGEKKGRKVKRNAIKQLYSTSVPQMVKKDVVYEKIEKDIKEEMRRILEVHIAAEMEKLK